ncbi:flavin prenyltransferase UbiX [Calditerricola yamamurae]|jgi:polyprenyl P-hydroxybenzoate and phenylacrylic acid decarboxylases
MNRERMVVGITGASGAVYGVTLVQALLERDFDVHLVVTEAGWQVLGEELGWDTSDRAATLERHLAAGRPGRLQWHGLRDYGAPIASGSFRARGMIVIPCSMGTLSGIATGASGNLLERAADVMLKEGRPLILVPRETPLNAIHLENMLRLARMGAHIVPAMPAFYHRPETVDDMVRFVVGKVLDVCGVDHTLFRRWGENTP